MNTGALRVLLSKYHDPKGQINKDNISMPNNQLSSELSIQRKALIHSSKLTITTIVNQGVWSATTLFVSSQVQNPVPWIVIRLNSAATKKKTCFSYFLMSTWELQRSYLLHVGITHGLSYTFSLVVACSRTNRIHMPPVLFILGVYLRV